MGNIAQLVQSLVITLHARNCVWPRGQMTKIPATHVGLISIELNEIPTFCAKDSTIDGDHVARILARPWSWLSGREITLFQSNDLSLDFS
jgi:hypothetical protein